MKNQKGVINIAIPIVIAVILAGLIAFGYFYWLPKEKENKNTNQVVNTNLNETQNQSANLNQNTNGTIVVNGNVNANVVLDSRCEAVMATTDCVYVAAPGYWYSKESGGCYYTSGEVCSNPPFSTHDECETVCAGNGSANTNTSIDETAGWKTYTNTQEGISFKYPPSWTIDNNDGTIVSVVAPKGLVRECVECPIAKLRAIYESYTKFIDDDSNITTITVGGIEASQGDDNGMVTQRETAIPLNGKILNVNWPDDENVNAIYDQILSTFYFTK